jgi:hypothetical protein
MRTKRVESLLRLDVVALDPRPAVYVAYDGLQGLSERPILRDLLDELDRQGPAARTELQDALRRHRSGQVHVYFQDYVSYGIGGGEATAEFFFGTFLLLHYPETKDPTPQPEQLVLVRPGGWERYSLTEVAA